MLSLPVADSPHGFGEFDGGALPIPHDRLSTLSLEHHDLDCVIDALAGAGTQDELAIARLKKRRLQIRDEIAGIVMATQLRGAFAPGAAVLPDEAEIIAQEPDAMGAAAIEPGRGGGSAAFAFLMGLSVLFALWLGWSDLADSVNQTLAQIYVLSLLAAANG